MVKTRQSYVCCEASTLHSWLSMLRVTAATIPGRSRPMAATARWRTDGSIGGPSGRQAVTAPNRGGDVGGRARDQQVFDVAQAADAADAAAGGVVGPDLRPDVAVGVEAQRAHGAAGPAQLHHVV